MKNNKNICLGADIEIDLNTQSPNAANYSGILDGNGHLLSINNSTANRYIVNTSKGATFRNLKLSGTVSVGSGTTALLVAQDYGSTYENILIDKDTQITSSGASVGGLIGILSGASSKTTIKDVYTLATVSSSNNSSNAGGIIGNISIAGSANGNLDIENVYNGGNVSSNGNTAGGIIGNIYVYEQNYPDYTVNISNAYTSANIESSKDAGGIIGKISFSEDGSSSFYLNMSNVYNSGDINHSSSGSYSGGIIGRQSGKYITVRITNAYNSGAITFSGSPSDKCGGIAGYLNNRGSFTNLANTV